MVDGAGLVQLAGGLGVQVLVTSVQGPAVQQVGAGELVQPWVCVQVPDWPGGQVNDWLTGAGDGPQTGVHVPAGSVAGDQGEVTGAPGVVGVAHVMVIVRVCVQLPVVPAGQATLWLCGVDVGVHGGAHD